LSEHIHPIFERLLSRQEREERLGQRSCTFWLTGLSGSGKSTLAQGLERRLFEAGFFPQVLDGDNIRTGISHNLGFSPEDRRENIRRIAEVARLYCHSGLIAICSFISPTVAIRAMARDIIGAGDFVEVHVHAPLAVCEARDVKGLYQKARAGEIRGFTGIDAPYEQPPDPDLRLDTHEQPLADSLDLLFTFARQRVEPA